MDSFRIWNKEENKEQSGTMLIDKDFNIYSVKDRRITKLNSSKYCIEYKLHMKDLVLIDIYEGDIIGKISYIGNRTNFSRKGYVKLIDGKWCVIDLDSNNTCELESFGKLVEIIGHI